MNKPHWRAHRPLFARPAAVKAARPHYVRVALGYVWGAVKRTATVIGLVMIFNCLLLLFVLPGLLHDGKAPPSLPSEMVLFLKLDEGFSELASSSGFSSFGAQQPTVREIVDTLDRAARDPRVKGFVLRMNGGDFQLAHSAEVRSAVKRFRAAGKFTTVYSASYGEGGGGLGRYYLASAFDQIWMQPLGVISIPGVSAEIPFGREALDTLGITPQFFQRKEFKTAYESITNKTISEPNKVEIGAVIGAIRREILTAIPADRKITPAVFEALIDKGLLTAPEALRAKLIDRMDYGDVLLEELALQVTGARDSDALDLVEVADYHAQEIASAPMSDSLLHHRSKVALVYVVGAIMPSAEGGPMGEDGIAAADEIAPVLHDIAKDDEIKAVIVRIDSPGGSPSASESILRGIEKIKAAGKPVIVSMGPTAASGGYWVAAYADRIFALPTTLTGSIGVVGGKFAIENLSAKIGVHWDTLSWGKNAGLWSVNTPFTPSQAERMNAMLDDVYTNFTARVVRGRKLSPEAVENIARGRVWAGADAVKIGLVDQLSGLSEAMTYVAKALKVKDLSALNVVVLPEPKTTIEKFIDLLEGQVALGGLSFDARALAAKAQPLLQVMDMQTHPQAYMTYEPLAVR